MHIIEPKNNGCVKVDGQPFAVGSLKVSFDGFNITVDDPGGRRPTILSVPYNEIRDPETEEGFTSFGVMYNYALANFFEDASGGGGGTLQSVTDGAGNNVTTNVLFNNGIGGYNPRQQGILMASSGGTGFIQNQPEGNGRTNITCHPSGMIQFNTGNSDSTEVNQAFILYPDRPNSGFRTMEVSGMVAMTPGVAGDEAVTVDQASVHYESSNDPNFIITRPGRYTYVGGDVANWTIAPHYTLIGKEIVVMVRGADMNLNTTGGENKLYFAGAASNTMAINTSKAITLFADADYFVTTGFV